MIRLDTAPTPNGRKVSMALEESGLPCEGIPVRIDRGEPVRPEFPARNPNPTIPVLEDDGQAIWESGAILFHLGQRHDPAHRILPGDPRRRMGSWPERIAERPAVARGRAVPG